MKSFGCFASFIALLSIFLMGLSQRSISSLKAEAQVFELDSAVTYEHKPESDCTRYLKGYITGLDGKPYDAIVINIQRLNPDGLIDMSYKWPLDGSWSAWLRPYDDWYYVWLTEKGGDKPLSDQVLIDQLSCEKNLAVIDFSQKSVLP